MTTMAGRNWYQSHSQEKLSGLQGSSCHFKWAPSREKHKKFSGFLVHFYAIPSSQLVGLVKRLNGNNCCGFIK